MIVICVMENFPRTRLKNFSKFCTMIKERKMTMQTNTITEIEAFRVINSDFNQYSDRKVSWLELRNAKVGDTFKCDANSNCGRDVCQETGKVIYKDESGVAVLLETYCTSDDPNPKVIEKEPVLTWFSFRD